MTWNECKDLIRQDLSRSTDRLTKRSALRFMITNSSFKMSFWFRIGTYLKEKNSKLLYFMVYWHYKHLMYKTGIQLPIGTKVGGGVLFKHFNGVVINDDAIIGINVTIFNGVTIGVNLQPDGLNNHPIIEDSVVLCTGAKIIGGITVGKGSIIGANAVVIKNIPEDSVAAGVPAKVISTGGGKFVEAYMKHK